MRRQTRVKRKRLNNHRKGKSKFCQRVKPVQDAVAVGRKERPVELHETYLTLK